MASWAKSVAFSNPILSTLHEYFDIFTKSNKEDEILIFQDWNPSGVEIQYFKLLTPQKLKQCLKTYFSHSLGLSPLLKLFLTVIEVFCPLRETDLGHNSKWLQLFSGYPKQLE